MSGFRASGYSRHCHQQVDLFCDTIITTTFLRIHRRFWVAKPISLLLAARLLAASLVISVGVTFCSQLEQKSCNGQKTAVMADDVQRTGEANPKNELVQDESAEDAETRATRRELKQSSISDGPSDEGGDEGKPDMDRPETPSLGVSEMQGNEVQEKISSPKKKRSHDQLEGNQEPQENDNTDAASSESANGRAVGCEPEKKRYREKKSSDTAQVGCSCLDAKYVYLLRKLN